MTIFLETPRNPTTPTFAGGVGTLGDIAGAAFDSLSYVENSNAAYVALERAYDDRIRAVHEATGAQLEHPLRAAEAERRRLEIEQPRSPFNQEPPRDYRAMVEDRMKGFDGELFSLGEKFPLARGAIGADRSVREDARQLAREADERLAGLMDSRDGLGKWAALLAGGAAASLRDPVTISSLVAGGGPGAARTFAGRMLTVAGKEMLINGATEAAVQPMVQAWRAEAGLSAGMDEAIRNVAFATVLGGAFGIAGQGVAEVLGRTAGRQSAAGSRQLDIEGLSDPARAILADDGLAAAASLATIREALPAPARGALDEAERIAAGDARRPPAASSDFHDRTLAAAERALDTPDDSAWAGFEPDAAQIERVAAEIYGKAAVGSRQSAPVSLVQFLRDRGGLVDDRGELKAIGAAALTRKRGRGADRRMPLDMAREAAEEAGYLGRAGETQVSSVADLLSAIDAELRGAPVYARGEDGGTAINDEAGLARVEGMVAEIARHAGPAVDDALIASAARLAIDEGLEPFDALERVLIADDGPTRGLGGRDHEPLPGWDDESLLAASDRRGAEPVPDGIADPGRLAPEDFDTRELDAFDDEDLIPGEDGQLVSIAELRARIEANDNMLAVVAACRV